MLELKMDPGTTFEWHKFSQDSADVPHYATLLEFLNLRAQASESTSAVKKRPLDPLPPKRVTSLATILDDRCLACRAVKHPLYACLKFKGLPHDQKLALLKNNDMCLNCLKPGHFVKRCVSTHRCHVCQKPHHTLLHNEVKTVCQPASNGAPSGPPASPFVSNVAQNRVFSSAVADDLSCPRHGVEWCDFSGESSTRLCLVHVFHFRTTGAAPAIASFATNSSSRWHWWHFARVQVSRHCELHCYTSLAQ